MRNGLTHERLAYSWLGKNVSGAVTLAPLRLNRQGSSGAILLMVGCQLPGSSSSCNAQIDWVNFIQVGSTQYVAGPDSAKVLQESDLGGC